MIDVSCQSAFSRFSQIQGCGCFGWLRHNALVVAHESGIDLGPVTHATAPQTINQTFSTLRDFSLSTQSSDELIASRQVKTFTFCCCHGSAAVVSHRMFP